MGDPVAAAACVGIRGEGEVGSLSLARAQEGRARRSPSLPVYTQHIDRHKLASPRISASKCLYIYIRRGASSENVGVSSAEDAP